MKIYTQNLHNYNEDDRYTKLEKIADYIKLQDIDIICLQEVGQYKLEDEIEGLPPLRQGNLGYIIQKILKKKYDLDYYLTANIFKLVLNSYEEGIAVLSKVKPERVKEFYVTTTQDFNNAKTRKIQKLYFNVAGQEFDLFNVHIGNTYATENVLEEFRRILEQTSNDKRYFIVGDLNIGCGSEEYKSIMQLGLHDLVGTCNPALIDQYTYYYGYGEVKSGNGRIDHVLSNEPSVQCSSNVFRGHEVSDHAGVMVEF